MPDSTPDLIVIGGGPAGSTAASMASRAGLSVILLEREIFPRHHVGESLLPASMPILEELGVSQKIADAGFLPKYGATMVWGKTDSPWSWRFSETNTSYPHAYQVSRSEFDNILIERSAQLGVDVRYGCRVTNVVFKEGRAVGVEYDDPNRGSQFLKCRFILDASGQAAMISGSKNLRQWDDEFKNLAVYAYFEGAERLSKPDQNNIFVESYENGWIWNIPIRGNISSVGVVVDRDRSLELLKKLSVQEFFDSQVNIPPYTSAMLKNAVQVEEPVLIRDWSYVSKDMAGNGWATVGDAACFIDPLFSSGVHMALMSGVLASAYAVTCLESPDMAEQTMIVYEELIRREYTLFRELASLFYKTNRSVDSYFWEARRISGNSIDENARASFVKAVSGQSVRGYERAVLERGDIPQSVLEELESTNSKTKQRESRLNELGPSIVESVPVLHSETKVEKKPVLTDRRFEWGTLLYSPDRIEGTACSRFVEVLISDIDGISTLGEISRRLNEKSPGASFDDISRYVEQTIKILYMEGAVSELR